MMAKNTKKAAAEAKAKEDGKAKGSKKSTTPAPKKDDKPKSNGEPVNPRKAPGQKVAPAELDSLRKPVEEAKKVLDQVKTEADQVLAKAKERVTKAKGAYQEALTPYRDACRKAKVACEYEGGRSQNVSEKVTFLVEKVKNGILVTVKGRPETEELLPMSELKKSVNRVAYAYTEKVIGARSEIGNKGGSLGNRLRAELAK